MQNENFKVQQSRSKTGKGAKCGKGELFLNISYAIFYYVTVGVENSFVLFTIVKDTCHLTFSFASKSGS